jgi:ABC-type transport system involved in multi-copper enzyme maturation permease subunit
MLSWRRLLVTFLRLCWLSGRIALHRKVIFMALGAIAYDAALYLFAVLRPGEGFSAEQALFVLVEVPGAVLAIYLTMDLVAGERDRNTLEILFTTATSHYAIWSVRLLAVFAALAVALLAMSTAAYLLFAEFPFVRGALNALIPAAFVLGLTLLLSVWTRSSNTAGMLALALLIGVLLASGTLKGSPYYLFLDPFVAPLDSDVNTWRQTIVLNRLGLVALTAITLGLGLRQMENRERFLA